MDSEKLNSFVCYEDILIDEVALEGLDGITLPILWYRLERNKYWNLKPLDRDIKKFALSVIVKISEIEWYQLTKPRPFSVLNDDLCEAERRLALNRDIYPHKIVNCNGIRGSCSDFESRIDVSNMISQLSLDEIEERYDSTIVAVASQERRNETLFTVDFCQMIELSDLSYCMLERIGRSRSEGCSSCELNTIKTGVVTPSHYYWKMLQNYKLITVQPYVLRKNGKIASTKLLHLVRFYKKVLTKSEEAILTLINYLKSLPSQKALLPDVRCKFDLPKVTKMKRIKLFRENITVKKFLYRTLFPNAPPSEYLCKNGNEKFVVACMLDPEKKVAKIAKVVKHRKSKTSGRLEGALFLNCSVLCQGVQYIDSLGVQGVTQRAFANHFGLPMLTARAILKSLIKFNCISYTVQEHFRQRYFKYFSKRIDYVKQDEINSQLRETEDILEDESEIPTTELCKDIPIAEQHSSKENEEIDENDEIEIDNDQKNNENNEEIDSVEKETENVDLAEKVLSPKVALKSRDLPVKLKKKRTKKLKKVGNLKYSNRNLKKDYKGNRYKRNMISNVSVRVIKRTNFVLKKVYKENVVYGLFHILKSLRLYEKKEGYRNAICRKSLWRIISNLNDQRRIKIINKQVVCEANKRSKECTFICRPDIDEDHPSIQSSMHQIQANLAVSFGKQGKKGAENDDDEEVNIEEEEEEIMEEVSEEITEEEIRRLPPHLEQLDNRIHENLKRKQLPGRRYGYGPKFYRMKLIHEVMYYLVYGYDGLEDLNQTEAQIYVRSLSYGLADELFDLPRIYRCETSWKMFIPPLKTYEDRDRGWLTCIDLILRLPLFIFLSVVNVNHTIPGVTKFLDDPIQRNLLIQQLPLDIQNHLTAERRFAFAIVASLRNLCMIGLLQFGDRQTSDVTSAFVYVNKKTQLMDTSVSPPAQCEINGDIEYPKKYYEFNSLDDVNQYWNDAMVFCLNTNLGIKRKKEARAYYTDITSKESIKDALRPRAANEAQLLDTGEMPGDRLGAAGYDSLFFSHMSQGWIKRRNDPLNIQRKATFVKYLKEASLNENKSIRKRPLDHYKSEVDNTTKISNVHKVDRRERITTTTTNSSEKFSVIKLGMSTSSTKPRKRRLIHDQADLEAIRRMDSLRSIWSDIEDNTLLIGYVASLYVKCVPVSYVHYVALREILYKISPQSKNKTSEAIRRRTNQIKRHPDNRQYIFLCLKSIVQDPNVKEMFGNQLDKIKRFYAKRNTEKMYKLMDALLVDVFDVLHEKYPSFRDLDKMHAVIEMQKIPNSLQDFKDNYSYEYITNLVGLKKKRFHFPDVNKDDIICSVINSLIYSALFTQQESGKRDSRSIHDLDQIFKQFSDSNLQTSFTNIRKSRMLAFSKSSYKYDNPTFLPLGDGTYHLSITYHFIFRCAYDLSIFNEAYDMYKKLLCTSPNQPLIIRQHDVGTVIALNTYMVNGQIYFNMDHSLLKIDSNCEKTMNDFDKTNEESGDLGVGSDIVGNNEDYNDPGDEDCSDNDSDREDNAHDKDNSTDDEDSSSDDEDSSNSEDNSSSDYEDTSDNDDGDDSSIDNENNISSSENEDDNNDTDNENNISSSENEDDSSDTDNEDNNCSSSSSSGSDNENNSSFLEDNSNDSENNSNDSEDNSNDSEDNSNDGEDNSNDGEDNTNDSEDNSNDSEDNSNDSDDSSNDSEDNSNDSEDNNSSDDINNDEDSSDNKSEVDDSSTDDDDSANENEDDDVEITRDINDCNVDSIDISSNCSKLFSKSADSTSSVVNADEVTTTRSIHNSSNSVNNFSDNINNKDSCENKNASAGKRKHHSTTDDGDTDCDDTSNDSTSINSSYDNDDDNSDIAYSNDDDDDDDEYGGSDYSDCQVNMTEAQRRAIRNKLNLSQQKKMYSNFYVDTIPLTCYLKNDDPTCIILDESVRSRISNKIGSSTIFRACKLSDEEIVSKLANYFRDTDVAKLTRLLEFILNKQYIGATPLELREHFPVPFLVSGTEYLVRSNAVLRTGINETHYVHRLYSDCWLMRYINSPSRIAGSSTSSDSLSNLIETNTISVIMRPWIRVDGSVNYEVLYSMMARILLNISEMANVPLKTVYKQYLPALQVQHIREILQFLKELGAICMMHVNKKKSSTSYLDNDEEVTLGEVTGFEEEDGICVQPDSNGMMKLSILIGDRNMKDDVLSMKLTKHPKVRIPQSH